VRHFGIPIEPAREAFQLITTNFAMFYSISQMSEQRREGPRGEP
jgi:hypothetical protein